MKAKLFVLISCFLVLGLLTWCWKYISKKAAQNAALLDAGFNRSDVVFIETDLDREEWIYEIDFIANGKYKYEYEINARNWEVMFDIFDRN